MKIMKIVLIISAVFNKINGYIQTTSVDLSPLNQSIAAPLKDESVTFIHGAPRIFMKNSTNSTEIRLADNTCLRFDYTKKGNIAFLEEEETPGHYTCKNLGKMSGAITDIRVVENNISKQLLLCVDYKSKYLKQRYIAVGAFDKEQWSRSKIKRIKKDDQLFYSGGNCSIARGNTYTDYSLEKENDQVKLKTKHTNIGIAEKNRRARLSHALHSALKRLSITRADTL